jgi:hemin uptake protein HemP
MKAITHGNVFNASAFTETDTLALIISALNSTLEETKQMTYYLAIQGEKNNGWVKVPLTALDKAAGLSFRMTTTDVGRYGSNTPLYFALDALTVNTQQLTDVQNIGSASSISSGQLVIEEGSVLIRRNGALYSLTGQRIY